MKWLLSMFVTRCDALDLRSILLDLPKAIAWGLLTGPFISLCFQLAIEPRGVRYFLHPEVIFWSAVAGACFSVSFWFVMGVGNRLLRRLVAGYPASVATPITMIANMAGASLAAAAAAAAVKHLPGPIKFDFPYFWRIVAIDAIVGGVVALVIGAFARLRKQIEAAQTELREKEMNERRLAEAAARAQALALQAQINPHFFFNALNSISVLVKVNPAAAQEMIGRLADMFRYTFSCSQGDAVALRQELEFVKDYLAIEQARFQKRLRVEWPQEPLPDIQVPGLVMQPLVENAVKHGIAPALEGGTLRIVIAQENGRSRIAVQNTSALPPDLSHTLLFRPGHALENVRARLRLFTGVEEPLGVQYGNGWTESAFTI